MGWKSKNFSLKVQTKTNGSHSLEAERLAFELKQLVLCTELNSFLRRWVGGGEVMTVLWTGRWANWGLLSTLNKAHTPSLPGVGDSGHSCRVLLQRGLGQQWGLKRSKVQTVRILKFSQDGQNYPFTGSKGFQGKGPGLTHARYYPAFLFRMLSFTSAIFLSKHFLFLLCSWVSLRAARQDGGDRRAGRGP